VHRPVPPGNIHRPCFRWNRPSREYRPAPVRFLPLRGTRRPHRRDIGNRRACGTEIFQHGPAGFTSAEAGRNSRAARRAPSAIGIQTFSMTLISGSSSGTLDEGSCPRSTPPTRAGTATPSSARETRVLRSCAEPRRSTDLDSHLAGQIVDVVLNQAAAVGGDAAGRTYGVKSARLSNRLVTYRPVCHGLCVTVALRFASP